jgi:hypothetical protein
MTTKLALQKTAQYNDLLTLSNHDVALAQVHAVNKAATEPEKITWPPILGLFMSVVVTLTSLRRNRVQAEIGESYGVS